MLFLFFLVLCVLLFVFFVVNECWLADRDRFSYEALNTSERLTAPMLKQGGQWKTVDWQTALEYVARGVNDVKAQHGAKSIGALVSPHSTVEELFLAQKLIRALGSENVDYRLRNAEFVPIEGVRWLGTSIASLSKLDRALVVGSFLRKDHPLYALRLRQAARHGAQIHAVNALADDWLMPVATQYTAAPSAWVTALADIAHCVAKIQSKPAPFAGECTPQAEAIAASLLNGTS